MLYRSYCQRGNLENRIKELHYAWNCRTSCTSFLGQSVPCLMTAAAYVLLQEAAIASGAHGCARAQVSTLREALSENSAFT